MDINGVVDAANVNWSLLKPSEPRETQYKSHYVVVNYNDPNAQNGRLRVRMGKMRAPFGASMLKNEKDEMSYSVNLAFSDLGAADPELGESFEFCRDWDNWVRDEAKKRSKEWLNKRSVSDDSLDDKYKPMMIYSRDKKTKEILCVYPPRIKLVLDRERENGNENDTFSTVVFVRGRGNEPVPFNLSNFTEVIGKGDYVRPIIELKSIWFSAVGFGCKWRLLQGRVYKNNRSMLTDITGGSDEEDEGEGLSDHELEQRGAASGNETTEFEVTKLDKDGDI